MNNNSSDTSGNSNNGYDSNMTYTPIGNTISAKFNGANSRIRLNVGEGIRNTFTLSIWVLINNMGGGTGGALYSNGTDASGGWGVELDVSITLFNWSVVSTSPLASHNQSATISSDTTTWHNYVIVYDNTAKTMNGYFDGNVIATAVSTGTGIRGARDVYLGTQHSGAGYTAWFIGSMDEVIMENVAWSASTVLNYYNNSKCLFGR